MEYYLIYFFVRKQPWLKLFTSGNIRNRTGIQEIINDIKALTSLYPRKPFVAVYGPAIPAPDAEALTPFSLALVNVNVIP